MEAWHARMRPVGMTADVLEAQIREQKVTTNDYISGNGSVLKVYMFIRWLSRFAKLVNVNF